MERLGYKVELRNCLSCQEQIMPLSFRWHTGKGGLVCTDCVKDEKQEWIDTKSVTQEMVMLLRMARENQFNDLLAARLPLDHLRQMLDITHELMQYHVPFASEIPFWQGVLTLDSVPTNV